MLGMTKPLVSRAIGLRMTDNRYAVEIRQLRSGWPSLWQATLKHCVRNQSQRTWESLGTFTAWRKVDAVFKAHQRMQWHIEQQKFETEKEWIEL